MISKLCLDWSTDLPNLQTKGRIFKRLDHLTGTKLAKIPATLATGALAVVDGQRIK
jgi:hypothetical protein